MKKATFKDRAVNTMTRPGRITYLVEKLTNAVESANVLRVQDRVLARTPSPETRAAREYAMAVKGRLTAAGGGLRPLEPWYARPTGVDPTGVRPFGDWDATGVAYMREIGRAGFMNRSQRRHFFPRAQRVDGVW